MTPKIVILKIGLTRNTRIAYNILTVFIKPFNRTSMESKHGTDGDSVSIEYSLLIEPVWNRNALFGVTSITDLTFNRTSMESKLAEVSDAVSAAERLLIEPVWNRNRRVRLMLRREGLPLLIEPVWNRNKRKQDY